MLIKGSLLFAAVNGALAVMLGAFGAHALKSHLSAAALHTWHTAVQYHFVHVLALLTAGVLLKILSVNAVGSVVGSMAGKVSLLAFMVGIILFCGSLYVLALGGPRWLGPVTPLGGLCFIIGWLTMTVHIALLLGD